MMRRRNHQPAMIARECFDKMRSICCEIDDKIDNLEGTLDVEGDEFHRIRRIVNYKLDFWWKKLEDSGQAWDPEQFNIYEMFCEKLDDVHLNLRACTGTHDVTSSRMRPMGAPKEAQSIFDPESDDMTLSLMSALELLKEAICHLSPESNDMTCSRMRAMDILKEAPLILDPVTEGISLVNEVEMIARPKELEDIASLLVSEHSNAPSVFPILGKPGSGKSSLVYFLFHHHLVKQHFDHRIWIRWQLISGVRSAQEMLKIVKETFYFGSSELEKPNDWYAKYMVVVEDLSNEGDMKWFDLLEPLLSAFSNCKKGTKIIVTSNSTSRELQLPRHFLPLVKGAPYLLKSLHHDHYLAFFKSIAFRGFTEVDKDTNLHDIALAIFDKFGYNLRVITTVASILSSQPPSNWQYFNEVVLNLPNPGKHILPLLDLMQHRLFSHYLSLFPLNYIFSKEDFSQFWDAQKHFIAPLKAMFEKLLGNDFLFKCCKTDKNGFLVKYRVHISVHKIAKHLAPDRYRLIENHSQEVNPFIIQHVTFIVDSSFEAPYWLSRAKYLKSLLMLPRKSGQIITSCDLNKLLKDLPELRALDVACVNCRNSLDTIGKLTELRYLRLGVSFKYLPECITNLQFLQTLDLRHSKVRELPAGFHELCHLKHLYTGDRLIDLPPKFGELTELQTLDVFIVGKHNGLDPLANFTNLAGNLKIRYQKGREEHAFPEVTTLLQDKKLHELSMEWSSPVSTEPAGENYNEEDVMELELLQPPSTLKSLVVKGWKGERFPQWAMDHFSSLLSNLVSIHIADCSVCKHLPSLSKLGFLKSLALWGLIALEWIEICDDDSTVSSKIPYFPSLEHLILVNLPQLKMWSKEMKCEAVYEPEKDGKQSVSYSILPHLYELRVSGCPELISMPLMPKLRSLEASNIHEDLLQHFLGVKESPASSSSASPAMPVLMSLRSLILANMSMPESLPRGFDFLPTTLEELSLCWLFNLRNLPESIGNFLQLRRLVIRYLPNLVDLPESLADLSTLECVEIRYCPRLRQVPRYFSNLKSLQRLEIKECVNLERRCQQPDGMDWHLIHHIPNINLG